MAAHQAPLSLGFSRILQARTLEWVAISFSNAGKWKVKMKSLSRVRLLASPWTAAQQALPSMRFSRQEYWSGEPLLKIPIGWVNELNPAYLLSTFNQALLDVGGTLVEKKKRNGSCLHGQIWLRRWIIRLHPCNEVCYDWWMRVCARETSCCIGRRMMSFQLRLKQKQDLDRTKVISRIIISSRGKHKGQ